MKPADAKYMIVPNKGGAKAKEFEKLVKDGWKVATQIPVGDSAHYLLVIDPQQPQMIPEGMQLPPGFEPEIVGEKGVNPDA